MNKKNSAQIVCFGGILSALAVLFQSSPIFLPVFGMLLSPFATLPIAAAAASSASTGVISFLSATVIISFISPQEGVIFFLTTGSFGLVLGLCHNGKKAVHCIAISAAALFTGINILMRIAGIASFSSINLNMPLIIEIFVLVIFSLLYSCLWLLILNLVVRLIKKTKSAFYH